MGSPQALSERDRRIVAAWAADCAERVLWLFEAEAPDDPRPRVAIARTRAFARGELDVAGEIRRRFVGGGAARDVKSPAAAAAARAAGQAAAVAHMGAHALGAAAYAAKAVAVAAPDRRIAAADEIRWQLSHMSAPVQAALRLLPPVGEDPSGPLGPGLLASGLQGAIIRDLQCAIAGPDPASRPESDALPSSGSLAGVSAEPFVPDEFDPPRELQLPEFHLVPLGAEHNESDHAAWTSSIPHIRATPGFESGGWPPAEGMSLEANRLDLERHARDFAERTGFTFTVLRPGTAEVIGCLYIYPAKDGGGDAQVRSWVRADVAELDGPLHAAVTRWLIEAWPFDNPTRFPRDER